MKKTTMIILYWLIGLSFVTQSLSQKSAGKAVGAISKVGPSGVSGSKLGGRGRTPNNPYGGSSDDDDGVTFSPEESTETTTKRSRGNDKPVWTGPGCRPPEIQVNGTRIHPRTDFSNIKEVKFETDLSPLGEKRTCKVKCVDGRWQGPLCQVHNSESYSVLLKSCSLEHVPSQLVVSYKNKTVPTTRTAFPSDAKLSVRCREVGRYKLFGEPYLVCNNGVWSTRIPTCIPTTIITNFTVDAPPTLLYSIPTGSAAISSAGELVVYPDSNVHLECLFSRNIGNPEWKWSPKYRQYPTGWAIKADERDYKYRLSIYYMKPQDSGQFTCSTPRGQTNSITLVVQAIDCAPFVATDASVSTRIEGTNVGHMAHFHCPSGSKLNGPQNITCEATGKWSAEPPGCVPINCPEIMTRESNLQILEQNTSYGGRIVFSCPAGSKLHGQPGLECEETGEWSGPLPTCKDRRRSTNKGVRRSMADGRTKTRSKRTTSNHISVRCPPPLPPLHGHLLEAGGRYYVGDSVGFACSEGYQMVGEATIMCNEEGIWSRPVPFCRQACQFPGDPEHGRVSPVKFYYEPGDRIIVTCNAGYVPTGRLKAICLGDGTWSGRVPECRGYAEV